MHVYRVMKTLKVSALPPLVYQLLVLSGKGHRSMVLEGIKVLFCQLDQDVLGASEEVVEEDRYVPARATHLHMCEYECCIPSTSWAWSL